MPQSDGRRAQLAELIEKFGSILTPTEAETEKELIWPTLELLGWAEMAVQPNMSVKSRDDVPDALLFSDSAAKIAAMPLPAWQRFQHGACVVEAKRWGRVLDRAEESRRGDPGVPSTQILRYLRRVDDVTKGHLRWGMLTNGRQWRLYFSGALSVAEDFLEIDLGKLFRLPGCERDLLDRPPEGFSEAAWDEHVFKLFVLMFGRAAFVPAEHGDTFHQLALQEGKQWEARVAHDLSQVVFAEVFPSLGEGLVRASGRQPATIDAQGLEEVRQAALILLYRLLFVLYAEDRNLLPDETGPYASYSLTRMRGEIAEMKALVPYSPAR